jgi:hypothetical protein
MNFLGMLFTVVMAGQLLSLPRAKAALALLLGASYMALTQQLDLGVHLPVMRILIAVGFLRVMSKSEQVSGGLNSLDKLMLLWLAWNFCTIFFHDNQLVFRLGTAYDIVGPYFLFRIFLTGTDDIRLVFKMFCLWMIPLALLLLAERFTGKNIFGLLGIGSTEEVTTHGHNRAQGPFGHPILAGVMGAVCFPMATCFWRENKSVAIAGGLCTLGIVYASGSSGPVMTLVAGMGALGLWLVRDSMAAVRWCAAGVIVVLAFMMNDPIYYLMARIDITGGSTGYFRAQLIQSAINHLGEWWLAGTDHTRHWMASGIDANTNHTDMTNYFLQMGVWGGLGLMLIFMAMIVTAYVRVGKALSVRRAVTPESAQFVIWSLGAILFAHSMAFWSISYFDQTTVFLCLVLAAIGSVPIRPRVLAPAAMAPEVPDPQAIAPEPRKSRSPSAPFFSSGGRV